MLIYKHIYSFIYGFAPCRRPLVNRQLLTDWLLKWVIFWCKTVILETSRLHFGYLGHHFGDPGIQGVTQRDTWRSRCRFLVILWWFGESLGSHFGHLFLIFYWFGLPKWETVSRSMFLVIRGWKWCQIAEASCAITTIKLMLLNGFTFSICFTKLVPRGWF